MALTDLDQHALVKQVSGGRGIDLDPVGGGAETTDRMPGDLVVTSQDAARNVILTGRVIGLLADDTAAALMREGKLLRILPQWQTRDQAISSRYPHRVFRPAKFRAVLDYLEVEIITPRAA